MSRRESFVCFVGGFGRIEVEKQLSKYGLYVFKCIYTCVKHFPSVTFIKSITCTTKTQCFRKNISDCFTFNLICFITKKTADSELVVFYETNNTILVTFGCNMRCVVLTNWLRNLWLGNSLEVSGRYEANWIAQSVFKCFFLNIAHKKELV